MSLLIHKRIVARLLLFPLLPLLACAAESRPEEPGSVAALLGVDWRLTSIKTPDQTIELQSSDGIPTVRFSDEREANSEQGRRISGHTGCNTFEGAYILHDGQAISVEYLTATEIFCGQRAFEIEQAYLSALWSVETYELAGNTLRLFSGASDYTLTFSSNG